MSIIPCDENCFYQNDGICHLERLSTVSAKAEGCPYKKPQALNKVDSLFKTSDTAKL